MYSLPASSSVKILYLIIFFIVFICVQMNAFWLHNSCNGGIILVDEDCSLFLENNIDEKCNYEFSSWYEEFEYLEKVIVQDHYNGLKLESRHDIIFLNKPFQKETFKLIKSISHSGIFDFIAIQIYFCLSCLDAYRKEISDSLKQIKLENSLKHVQSLKVQRPNDIFGESVSNSDDKLKELRLKEKDTLFVLDNTQHFSTIFTEENQYFKKKDSLYEELVIIKTKKRKAFGKHTKSLNSIIPKFSYLKNKIKDNQAFIEYFINDSIYIFVISKTGYKVITVENKDEVFISLEEFSLELEKRCNLRNSSILYDKMLNKKLRSISIKLYNEIFQPIVVSGVIENVNELLIAPDYSIYSLPFEMLLQSTQDEFPDEGAIYLGDLFNIRYFQDANFHSDNEKLSDIFESSDKMLAISKSNFKEYPTLCNLNPINISKLRKSFNNIDIVLDEQATKEKLLEKNLFNYRYLYISTHVVINEIPELSYLALTNSQLSLFNTFDLNLNSKITVLSACQAANGSFQRGGGVMGFTKGLMYAGTESVVISLWPAEDKASEYLFNRFWANIALGNSPKIALQEAKQYLRRLDEKYDNPFYWAGFVLFGKS